MSTRTKRLSAIVAIVAILFVLGIRVGHPRSGLSTALGSASSSLVIYKANKELAINDKIFGASEDSKLSPVLGEVAEVGPNYYSVKNGKFLERVTKVNTRGKMLVVIPFFGYILNIAGL